MHLADKSNDDKLKTITFHERLKSLLPFQFNLTRVSLQI